MYWNYKEGPLDILMNILYFARFQVWTFNLEMYFEEEATLNFWEPWSRLNINYTKAVKLILF